MSGHGFKTLKDESDDPVGIVLLVEDDDLTKSLKGFLGCRQGQIRLDHLVCWDQIR